MNDSRLRTIEQIELFLSGNIEVAFSMQGDDTARYLFAHQRFSASTELHGLAAYVRMLFPEMLLRADLVSK